MSNETKRDVFEEFADECAGLNDKIYNQYMQRYDTALPDDLPVIPKSVADWINECISLGWTRNFLDVCYRAPEPVDKWIDNNSNMFARAWLDGYQVEAQHDTRTD